MSAGSMCPRCGERIAPDSPRGLCPRCLFEQARRPLTLPATAERATRNFVAPHVQDLAREFPQLEILGLLGQGGMGAVYKARQPGLDRLVALKILPPALAEDPSFAERFAREARMLARLNHPHIVAVYDSGRAGEYFYLLMEYVDGVNLREVMQEGTLDPQQALAIVPQICDALQYAHDEGVVHRDIKPENVLLDRRGRVKVADFGLAKLIAGPLGEEQLTATHQVMGTYRYMAPEQLEGARVVDHRADIYSLGVVLYELLTGELPLGRFALPSARAGVDARLDEVVLRTLEKEPQRRYQHASEVKSDLDLLSPQHRSAWPQAMHRYAGYEYRSALRIGTWPLVHIAYGIDPRTGRMRTARGIFAMGHRAIGVFAVGGLACGVFTMGGVGVGLVTFGGVALGLFLALGGVAVGAGLSLGGCAIGTVAVGGAAVGVFGFGGGVVAWHGYGGNLRDPLIADLLPRWGKLRIIPLLLVSLIIPAGAVALAALLVWLAKYNAAQTQRVARFQHESAKPPVISETYSPGFSWPRMVLGCLLPIVGLLLFAVAAYVSLARVRDEVVYPGARAKPAGTLAIASDFDQFAIWAASEHLSHEDTLRLQQDAREKLQLTVEQVAGVERVMAEAFAEYQEVERRHRQRQEGAGGEIITLVPRLGTYVAPIEQRFWSNLEKVLNAEQAAVAREKLRVYATYDPARQLVTIQPGMLGWKESVTVTVLPSGENIEIWVRNEHGQQWQYSGRELLPGFHRFGPRSDNGALQTN